MALDPDVAAGAAEAEAALRGQWVDGYEFALRNIEDEPVQADLEAQRPAKKRKRDAYLGLWVNRSARDLLDREAKTRGISRSEMARTVFGYGLAAMGIK